MYKTKTTFVIGAGASLELGFPTSGELKNLIAKSVNVRFDANRVISGDYLISEALRFYADYYKGEEIEEYNKYLVAGWHIARAMPQAISIDNFIENQQDEYITRVAKLGITSCLIDAEKNCWGKHRKKEHSDEVVWDSFQKNWIHSFFQTLTEGTKKSSLDEIFENLTFIVFNYDRSLEFFLTHCISNYYGISLHEASPIVASATFLHPYGQIGKLSWQSGDLPNQEFGSGNKSNIFDISKYILTFSEQIQEEEQLERIRSSIHEADQLVFLGFAFHDSNMQLLQPERFRDTKRVAATAYGISKPDCEVIEEQLDALCLISDPITNSNGISAASSRFDRSEIILDNDATCSSLFETYRRSLIS